MTDIHRTEPVVSGEIHMDFSALPEEARAQMVEFLNKNGFLPELTLTLKNIRMPNAIQMSSDWQGTRFFFVTWTPPEVEVQ